MTAEKAVSAAPTQGTGRPAGGRTRVRKPHIQAMRAVAVLAVIAYHGRPRRFPGGFVGVDIFFVVSGFLMTQTVYSLADRGLGTGRALREFYIRRATRLLPAALLTILITSLLVFGLENRLLWRENFFEALSSAAFFENWTLAYYSVDYLGAHSGSAFQHYWSLSVEEQFYLVWPIVVLTAILLAGRLGGRRLLVVLPLGALTIASFAYSVVNTYSNPSGSYFNTAVRFWELSIGGCAFLLSPYLRRVKLGGLWLFVGVTLVAYSILRFNATMRFPGAVAAIPVVGAVLFLVFGDFSPTSWPEKAVRWSASLRPIQWIGDQSYSLYLLHFPAITIATLAIFPPKRQVIAPHLSTPQLVVVLIVVFFGAWLLKTQVEDRFRLSRVGSSPTAGASDGKPRKRSTRPTWMFIATAAALVVVFAGGMFIHINSKYREADAALAAFHTADHTDCFAAVSTSPSTAAANCAAAHGGNDATTVPSPYIATNDFDESCQANTGSSVITCHYGSDATAAKQVALAGDSHATQWLPALNAWGNEYGYAITTYLKAGCPLVVAHSYDSMCADWNAAVTKLILKQHPDVVIVSGRSAESTKAANDISSGVQKAWAPLLADNLKIVAIRDVPQPDLAGILDMPTCINEHLAVSACTFQREPATSADSVGLAAAGRPQVAVIDMSNYLCVAQTCSGVIGGMLAFIDGSHLSGTFVGALSAALGRELNRALASGA